MQRAARGSTQESLCEMDGVDYRKRDNTTSGDFHAVLATPCQGSLAAPGGAGYSAYEMIRVLSPARVLGNAAT